MALAIILALLLAGSVIFNFVSPWQATPVASNWGSIDATIVITLIITGVFFIGITLFLGIENQILWVADFFAIYLFYLVFEIYTILSNLRQISS